MRVEREINAGALRANFRAVRKRATAKNIIAVVKSNGYGHGLPIVADALNELADGFAVAEVADAKTLRARGVKKPVLLISGALSRADIADIAQLNLWTAARDWQQIEWLKDAPANANITVFLKADAGMNRLGFAPSEWAAAKAELSSNPAVGEVILMAHFARADEEGGITNALTALSPLRELCASASLGNSAATLLHDDIGDDWARVGIALYGSSPSPQWKTRDELGLSAAMTLRASIMTERIVRAGECVGYGGEWRAQKDTRAAIVSCGYADGYPRLRGNTGAFAMIGGTRAPVIGRVSMEMTALDISKCPADIGDKAAMWGESPSIDDIATAAGRISYELLSSLPLARE